MTVGFDEAVVDAAGDSGAVARLYAELVRGWNDHDATRYASVFAGDGSVIGFDGSEQSGRGAIEAAMATIFQDHETAAYVAHVRGVEFLAPGVALLRAAAGMVPPGETELKPDRHAHHTVVATHGQEEWKIRLFQNTPAQFHGRPEMVDLWTEELRQVQKDAAGL
jgi:uncharacterized protein (TIGR02246 family)